MKLCFPAGVAEEARLESSGATASIPFSQQIKEPELEEEGPGIMNKISLWARDQTGALRET